MKKQFNRVKKTILIVSFVLLLPLAASAFEIKKGDSVYVPRGQTVEGNLYAAGSAVTIEGKINGDVICAGQAINISGEVTGDVICAGQTINVAGQVGGSVRAAGNSVNLSGKVARNVMAFGATVMTTGESAVGWDMLVGAGFVQTNGQIGRDLYGGGGQVTIAGQVNGNVNLNLSGQNKNATAPLVIASTAKINGDVKYTAKPDATVESGAAVKGKITHNLPKTYEAGRTAARGGQLFGNLIFLFAALVMGLVMVSFWRETIINLTDLMLKKPAAAFGRGILTLILTPIIVVILLITVIGMPLAFISLALWLIALYLSKILAGILIGRALINRFWAKKKDSLILAMVIGVALAYIIFSIPFLGGLAAFLAVLWGLGGIILTLKKA